MTTNDAVEKAMEALAERGWEILDIQAVANLAAAILIADQLGDIGSCIAELKQKL